MARLQPARGVGQRKALEPLPLLGAGLLVGVLAHGDPRVPAPSREIENAIALFGGLALSACGALWGRTPAWLLVTTAALLGFARAEAASTPTRETQQWRPMLSRDGTPLVHLEGIVDSPDLVPSRAGDRPGGTRFRLRAAALLTRQGRVPVGGLVPLTLEGTFPRAWIGARIAVVAATRVGPNAPEFRTRRGAVRVLAGRRTLDIGAWIDVLRHAAAERLAERISPRASGIASALVLGLPAAMTPEERRAHADTGTIPFLAISGCHVALVAMGMGLLLGRRRTRRARALALTVCLFVYAAAAGRAPPVLRAAVGFAYLAIGTAAGRRANPWSALAAALTLELAFRPHAAFTPGFQLSYGAVVGFLAFLAGTQRCAEDVLTLGGAIALRAPMRQAASALALAVVAFLSTATVCAAHFGQVAPVAVLLSFPLTLLVPPLLATGWAALLPHPFGFASARLFEILERCEREVVAWGDRLPGSPLFVRESDAIWIAGASLTALFLLTARTRFAALAAAAAVLSTWTLPSPPRGRLELWLHDCGHGLAATLIGPNGGVVQMDAGSRDRFDLERAVLRRRLDALGVRAFAAVSLSHADLDHASALPELLARTPTRWFIRHRDSPWTARLRGPPPDWQSEAGSLALGDARIEWIAVDPGAAPRENDRSIVAIVTYAGRRLWLPGDLERRGVEALLAGNRDPRADVLVLPHHGLDNGQVERLLEACRPAILLASCGAWYSTRSTEARAAARGLRVHTTREFGTLRLRVEADGSATLTAVAPP